LIIGVTHFTAVELTYTPAEEPNLPKLHFTPAYLSKILNGANGWLNGNFGFANTKT